VDVGAWLQSLGLGQYETVFEENAIDGEVLPDLTDQDFISIGVLLGHRKKLLKAIAALSDEATAAAAPAKTPSAAESAAAERRQLTVMFCDLAGSTELSSRLDPEDLQDVIRAYQESCAKAISQFDGYLAKYMGDGVLAYFGYPQAHENDTERALRAALAVVDAVPKLNADVGTDIGSDLAVRVGIATGIVVVGEIIGEGDAQERTVVGETPNLAARMQGLAAPNGIVVGSVPKDLAGDGFIYEDLGAHELKGITGLVKAWGVRGLAEAVDEDRAAAPTQALVGRDEEVGLLRRAWQQTTVEGRGQAVFISGEPGIGKSALVETLRGQVREEGRTRIAFRCSPYHTGSSLYPVIDHLQRMLGWQGEEAPEQRLAMLEAMVSGTGLAPAETVPLLASLLSLPLPDGRFAPLQLSPQQQRQQTYDALIAWLLEEAERHTLLAMCEDLHWADPTTLEFLGLLLEQAPTVPILLVFTARPDFQASWPARSHMTPITLARLERPQTEVLITRVAGGKALPPEVVDHIVTKTDGVPLYVEELTKTVLGSEVLTEQADRYALAGSLSSVTIPATLHDSLMERLDRFPKMREVVQLGAVLGREFAYEMLRALAETEESLLQDGLDRLVDGELLYQRGRPPRARYIFKHALVQDAAYQSLLLRTRQRYHEQVAQLLETRFPEMVESRPEVIAHHYSEAGQARQALAYWQRAGQRALERSAHAEAIGHISMAIELLDSLPDDDARAPEELDLQINLGGCLAAVEGYAAARAADAYARAQVLCRQAGRRSQLFTVLRGLWISRLVRGELAAARALAEESAKLAESQSDRSVSIEGHHAMGGTLICLGDFSAARDHLEESIALYDRAPVSRDFMHDSVVGILPRCFVAHALWHLGYPDQAVAKMDDAVALASDLSHPFSIAMARDYAAMLHQFRREGPKALEWADSAIALCEERGFAYYLAWGRIIRGWALVEAGGGALEIGHMRDGLAALRATGAALRLPYYLATLGEASGRAGRTEEGLQDLEEALSVADAGGERWREAELYRLKGDLLLTQSAAAEADAEACFRQGLDVARNQQAKALELRAAMSLARLWQRQGKRAAACDLLAPLHDWFTEGFDTRDLQDTKALLDELA